SRVDFSVLFFLKITDSTANYTLSLHDALPILQGHPSSSRTRGAPSLFEDGASCPNPRRHRRRRHRRRPDRAPRESTDPTVSDGRSEEHTSELQSPCKLVCRLLLEKKKATRRTR